MTEPAEGYQVGEYWVRITHRPGQPPLYHYKKKEGDAWLTANGFFGSGTEPTERGWQLYGDLWLSKEVDIALKSGFEPFAVWQSPDVDEDRRLRLRIALRRQVDMEEAGVIYFDATGDLRHEK